MEVERHYSDACLEIFEDDEWEKLTPIDVVVEKFKKIFEEASNDDDIRQEFRIEEALLDLDVKLREFLETRIKVGNYRKRVKEKYESLYFQNVTQVTKIIEKLKRKYLDIALV